jgi:hypothetical protein
MAVSAKPPGNQYEFKRRYLFTRPPPDDTNHEHKKEVSEERTHNCRHEMSLDAKEKAGRLPATVPHPSDFEGSPCVKCCVAGKVRRSLRFSLAGGKRRKSRKPAPLPA